LPAIEAGCWGVHVPHELTWVLDHADAPPDLPRFRQVSDLGALSAIFATLR
jgi:putative hydrolase of the HAD superfamily